MIFFLTTSQLNVFLNTSTKHFGFSIKDLQWHYNKEIVSKIVESTFDTLAGKISTVLSYYSCDIVLLSGRPTSLKPLSDLFFEILCSIPK
jgi:hypothetical protein